MRHCFVWTPARTSCLLFVLFLGCLGCGEDGTSLDSQEIGTEGDEVGIGCVPDAPLGCFCDDGSFGSQICLSDGISFGPCNCEAPGFGGNETGDELQPEGGDEAGTETAGEIGEETGEETNTETGDETGDETSAETSDESNTENVCVPDCTGQTCGDNGCGGTCGSCAPGEICSEEGLCETLVQPSCEEKCGQYDASASCQCDPSCEQYGDCCPDYTELCPNEETGDEIGDETGDEIGDEVSSEEGSETGTESGDEGGEPLVDACDNPEDGEAHEAPKFNAAQEDCTLGCSSQENPDACLTACMVQDTGLSLECASCFGDLLQCVLDTCITACAGGDSSDCNACIAASGCSETFDLCTNFPEVSEETGDETGDETGSESGDETGSVTETPVNEACTNPEDLETVGSGQAKEMSAECSIECAQDETSDFETCIIDCLTTKSSLSVECASCFAALSKCSVEDCLVACTVSPEACTACMDTLGCTAAFAVCSGIGDPEPPTPLTETNCDDKADDDEDGLTDCTDPDCVQDPACVEEQSCSAFYLCLAEEWCECTVGVDCPETSTQEFTDCQMGCYQDNGCVNNCLNSLDPKTETDLNAYMTCTQLQCAGLPDNESYFDCVLEKCAPEYGECFYTGINDCSYFYFDCAGECDDDEECVAACAESLSPQGFTDAVEWDACRLGLCDMDKDGSMDSAACQYIGNYLACADQAGSCFPDTLLSGTNGCSDTLDCVIACDSFDPIDCLSACILSTGAKEITAISGLFTCVISTCGSGSGQLTPACIQNSLTGLCAGEYLSCSSGESFSSDLFCEGLCCPGQDNTCSVTNGTDTCYCDEGCAEFGDCCSDACPSCDMCINP